MKISFAEKMKFIGSFLFFLALAEGGLTFRGRRTPMMEEADGDYGRKKGASAALLSNDNADGSTSYGDKKSGYTVDEAAGYGGKKAGYDTYGATAFGGKKAGYDVDGAGYGCKKAGYDANGSYGGKKGGACVDADGDGSYGGKKVGYEVYGGKKGGGYGDADGVYGGKKASYGANAGDEYAGKKGGKKGCTPLRDDDCEICGINNWSRPSYLKLKYISVGVESFYQTYRSTCEDRFYPLETEVSISGVGDFELEDGDVITLRPPGGFGAETRFRFGDGYTCEFHTSCSEPIVAGDQFGPFLIVAGNDCDKPQPTPSPTPNPTLDPTPDPTPGPTRDPTPGPTRPPTRRPTPGPTPDPTPGPTPGPTRPPTPGPTRPPTSEPTRRPTRPPTPEPTRPPTPEPTRPPTPNPSPGPTRSPSRQPTRPPTPGPTPDPTPGPTPGPTPTPTPGPTPEPKRPPTPEPTRPPSPGPTPDPTPAPTPACIIGEVRLQQGTPVVNIEFFYPELDPRPSDWVGIYPCSDADLIPPFSNEPLTWAYTCYDRVCRNDDPSTATGIGSFTFDDNTLPAYANTMAQNTITELVNNQLGCYVILLNRVDGDSAPPYYGICEGNQIELGDGSTPAPINPTPAPVNPTPAPINPTPAPVNPTAMPVDSSQPATCNGVTPTGCSVCGDGKFVSAPNAIFAFPGQPSVPCGLLETAGLTGSIPLDQCGFLPSFLLDTCGCEDC